AQGAVVVRKVSHAQGVFESGLYSAMFKRSLRFCNANADCADFFGNLDIGGATRETGTNQSGARCGALGEAACGLTIGISRHLKPSGPAGCWLRWCSTRPIPAGSIPSGSSP